MLGSFSQCKDVNESPNAKKIISFNGKFNKMIKKLYQNIFASLKKSTVSVNNYYVLIFFVKVIIGEGSGRSYCAENFTFTVNFCHGFLMTCLLTREFFTFYWHLLARG